MKNLLLNLSFLTLGTGNALHAQLQPAAMPVDTNKVTYGTVCGVIVQNPQPADSALLAQFSTQFLNNIHDNNDTVLSVKPGLHPSWPEISKEFSGPEKIYADSMLGGPGEAKHISLSTRNGNLCKRGYFSQKAAKASFDENNLLCIHTYRKSEDVCATRVRQKWGYTAHSHTHGRSGTIKHARKFNGRRFGWQD